MVMLAQPEHQYQDYIAVSSGDCADWLPTATQSSTLSTIFRLKNIRLTESLGSENSSKPSIYCYYTCIPHIIGFYLTLFRYSVCTTFRVSTIKMLLNNDLAMHAYIQHNIHVVYSSIYATVYNCITDTNRTTHTTLYYLSDIETHNSIGLSSRSTNRVLIINSVNSILFDKFS